MSNTPPDFTHLKKNQRAFLCAFLQIGTITGAAEAAKVGRRTHYDWVKEPLYLEAFKIAEDACADMLEAEARRRAIYGVEKPVFYQGQECGTVREYSDTLLIFLLKGRRPEVFSDKKIIGGSINDNELTSFEFKEIEPVIRPEFEDSEVYEH